MKEERKSRKPSSETPKRESKDIQNILKKLLIKDSNIKIKSN
jgi:hypothetical protein